MILRAFQIAIIITERSYDWYWLLYPMLEPSTRWCGRSPRKGWSNSHWWGLGLVLTVVSNAGAQYQVGVVEVPIGSEVVAHVSQHHCVLQQREHWNNRDTTGSGEIQRTDHVAKEMNLKGRSDGGKLYLSTCQAHSRCCVASRSTWLELWHQASVPSLFLSFISVVALRYCALYCFLSSIVNTLETIWKIESLVFNKQLFLSCCQKLQ